MTGKKTYGTDSLSRAQNITIYQPNRLTNACFEGFGLLHLRIFIAVLKQLQARVLAAINGTHLSIATVFTACPKDCPGIAIPLKEITSPNHYARAVTAANDITNLPIRIKQKDVHSGRITLQDIFSKVGLPLKINGVATIHVQLPHHIPKALTDPDRNEAGKAINFTSYNYDVAMAIRSKHTLRLYILISSWKNRGGFFIDLADLKQLLGLGKGYGNFSVFRKEILLPAHKELEQLGDCWFNAPGPSSCKKKGGRVTSLSFRVITKKTGELRSQKIQQIEDILRLHGGFRDADIKALGPLFDRAADLDALAVKVVQLVGKRTDANRQAIADRAAYINSALLFALPTEIGDLFE